ncbi:MAG: N-acetylmuramoyl-L-alanine amidase, partial [Firmicutes bacterium]|nr:N-acetylmuramoyl-L-alanine amidase [Bacillota bacterium]
VTRLEIAVESDALYEVALDDDRKSLNVSFKENNIYGITLSNGRNGDEIAITADRTVELNAERKTDPDRLIFDIKNARLTIDDGSLGDGKFSKNVRFSQYGSNKVRIAIDLDRKYSYEQSVSGKITTILISEVPQAGDISYDHDINTLKIGKNGKNVNINNFKHYDNYLDLTYKIVFDANVYTGSKAKEFVVEDDDMVEVDINSSDAGTVVTFYEQRILAYEVTEDESYIYIRAVEPKEKYDKIVVLDAGHGGSDCGAIGWGLYEEDITLDITNKIIAIAEKDNKMKVYCSRTTDVLPTFDERTDMGNEVGDVFVSVHINSAGANTAPHGTEVYMLNENTTPNGLTSSMLAGTLLNNLVEYLGSENRGVKSENFIVLRQSYNPAVLCEIGFITNQEEAGKLGTDEYRQKTAQAIYDGCLYLLENYGR